MIKYIILFIYLILGIYKTFSQSCSDNLVHQELLHQLFQEPKNGLKPPRPFLKRKNHSGFFTNVSGAMIFFYQNILSDQIQAECTYRISCSEYLKYCIDRFGFIKGTMAGLNQYMKCSSGNFKNHCEHRRDDANKIINRTNDETY